MVKELVAAGHGNGLVDRLCGYRGKGNNVLLQDPSGI
jgi:hypothetical protein